MNVDKVFIIALPGDDEKKKKLFLERLKAVPLAQTPVEICTVPPESQLSEALTEHKLQPAENKAPADWKETSMAIGHWHAWQKALEEKCRAVLVLEEGFLPAADHYNVLDTDEPWEMIYIGRSSYGSDALLGHGGLVRPGYSDGSVGYIIKQTGIHTLLASGYDRHLISPGEFLTAMHDSHPEDEIAHLFSGRLSVLAPMKNLIERDAAWNMTLENGATYTPLHPQLYDAFGKGETQWIRKYLNTQLVQKEFDLICDEPIDNVYTFPIFTPLFCKELIEEAEHYGQWMSYRGKNNPPMDMLLSSIGFNHVYTHMIKKFLFPLFYHKYQLQGKAWSSLNSQNFIVRYIAEQQGHLGLHNDGSYISMVVALNTGYEGGGTIFPKFKKLIHHDQPGFAAIHPGMIGYLHGARPVTKGRRYILASFFFAGEKNPFAEGTY